MQPAHSPDVHDDLPFVDEHRVLVDAPAATVWRTLAAEIAGPRFAVTERFAHLLATTPRRASGRLFDTGATLPGFVVTEAVPTRLVRLTGRHRFSRYALTLTLTEQTGGTLLSALTHAEFPGLAGGVYRGIVIRSGIHGLLLPRMLRSVRRRAERPSTG